MTKHHFFEQEKLWNRPDALNIRDDKMVHRPEKCNE